MTRAIAAIVTLLAIAVLSLLLLNSRLSTQASIARTEVEELRTAIERAGEAQKADRAMMGAQLRTIQAYDQKYKELKAYVAALPDRDAECLSADDTERLRSLWTP